MQRVSRSTFRSLLAIALVAALGGCGGPRILPTAEVAGTVNLDGKPMADGEILFASVAEGVSEVLPVKDGKFAGKVTVGEPRVEIRAYKEVAGNTEMYGSEAAASKENYLPAKYNTETTLKATVPKEGVKTLEFSVTST